MTPKTLILKAASSTRQRPVYLSGFPDDPGIANQAGYAPKFIVAGAEQSLNVLFLAHVSLHRDGAAVPGLAGLDDFGRNGGAGEVVYSDIVASGGEQPSRCGTDAAARARYDQNRSHEELSSSLILREFAA